MAIVEVALGLKMCVDALALSKAAVAGVKGMISNCKDPSEVAGYVDQVFQAQYNIENEHKLHKGDPQWKSFLSKKWKDDGQTPGESMSDITAEVIQKKQIEESIAQMARMINKRFGFNTWNEILDLRDERLEENKERRKIAKLKFEEEREKKRQKLLKLINNIGGTIVVIGVVALIWGYLWYVAK